MGAVSSHTQPDFSPRFGHCADHIDLHTPFSFEPNDAGYRLTLAVGDFDMGDISVTTQGRSLIVTGRRRQNFLRLSAGIVPSGFHWQFEMPRRLHVLYAALSEGILNIELGQRPAAARRPSTCPPPNMRYESMLLPPRAGGAPQPQHEQLKRSG